jgi:hypothetical protein
MGCSAEPQKLPPTALPGLVGIQSVGKAILAWIILPANANEPIAVGATGSLCRECCGYTRPERERPSRIVSGDVSELPAPACCWHPALRKPTIQRTTHDHRKKPMFPPTAEFTSAFSPQPAIGLPESQTLTSESPEPTEAPLPSATILELRPRAINPPVQRAEYEGLSP